MTKYTEFNAPKHYSKKQEQIKDSDIRSVFKDKQNERYGEWSCSRGKEESCGCRNKENFMHDIPRHKICEQCNFYRETLKFHQSIILILIGGFVAKLVLDNTASKK